MDIGGMIPPYYKDPSFPLHITKYSKSFEQPSCWHEDIEIKLICTNEVTVIIDNQPLTVQEGEIIFVNPYQIHSMPRIEDNDHLYHLYMIDLDFFRKCGIHSLDLRQLFMQNQVRIHNRIHNPKLSRLLEQIIIADESDSPYTLSLIQGLLLTFFSILLGEESAETVPEEMSRDRVKYYYAIEPALATIHEHYDKKLTGEELSLKCKMSLYYFYRIFKRVMGVTPVQYQTAYRLQIADVLLKNERHSISSVANMVGFEDEAYFSHCYRKARGISPREFRKNMKEF